MSATAIQTDAAKKELQSNVRPADHATQPYRIVLHKSRTNDEWVTHFENVEEDGKGGYRSKASPDYYWGNYHGSDYVKALTDYHTRCARYGL